MSRTKEKFLNPSVDEGRRHRLRELLAGSMAVGLGSVSGLGAPDATAATAATGGSTAGRFAARPYLFKADEARLRALIASNDPSAFGSTGNSPGATVAFLTLAKLANNNRRNFEGMPTWHLALAGWLLDDTSMLMRAHDEAMAQVNAAPGGDTGHGDDFQHVEHRLFDVAATADLAHAQFTPAELDKLATWVNGTLANWNRENLAFWPWDDPLNNYWQNGFLAHAIGGIATQGFNPKAAEWRQRTVEMARKFIAVTTPPRWNGPVQSEGHYYASYVSNAVWAMELFDAATGSRLLADAKFDFGKQLALLMYQTRPHLMNFFLVGSEAADSAGPHTPASLYHWYHMLHSGRASAEAPMARRILEHVEQRQTWRRFGKAFVGFYWNPREVPEAPRVVRTDRLFVAPTPGAGLVALRSAAGFEPTPDARAAIMFATRFNNDPAYSHSNPDAPGFQWAMGEDWLVTDPEFFASSGVMAEAGNDVYSDVSNIVTLAGQRTSQKGGYPVITHAEDHGDAAVAHQVVQINAQPYWTSVSVYRREYVWLDDLRVVLVFDRISGAPAKTWRLHVPGEPRVQGANVTYAVRGRTLVTARDLLAGDAPAWTVENLKGSLTRRDVWRLSQTSNSSDYRSLKVLDVGSRVSEATLATNSGRYQVLLKIDGAAVSVTFHDDGRRAVVA